MDKLRKRSKQIFLVFFLILALLYLADILSINLGWLIYPIILMIPVLFSFAIVNLFSIFVYESELKGKIIPLVLCLLPIIFLVYLFLAVLSIQC